MKLGIVSDIHCNVPGLERAFALLDDCDELLCAGDLLYQYRFSSEVLTILRHRSVHTIVGNHDKTILYAPSHPLRAAPTVIAADLEYLAGLPESIELTREGTRIAMFHGSPWDVEQSISCHYVYPANERDIRKVAQVDADVVVLGHTHQPYSVWVGETLVLNPGSCGESRDPSGLLSCAALDLSSGQVEIRSFSV